MRLGLLCHHYLSFMFELTVIGSCCRFHSECESLAERVRHQLCLSIKFFPGKWDMSILDVLFWSPEETILRWLQTSLPLAASLCVLSHTLPHPAHVFFLTWISLHSNSWYMSFLLLFGLLFPFPSLFIPPMQNLPPSLCHYLNLFSDWFFLLLAFRTFLCSSMLLYLLQFSIPSNYLFCPGSFTLFSCAVVFGSVWKYAITLFSVNLDQ